MKQWEIMGEMRKRIKIRLDAEGIEIPFPHQTVYWGEAQPPFRPEVVADAVRNAESMPQARPAPQTESRPSTVTAPQGQPAAGSLDDEPMTPERREELLAAITIATASRVSDASMDIQARTMLFDTSDGE